MIVSIPKNKILKHKLNESLFDDDIFNMDNDLMDTLTDISTKEYEEEQLENVKKILNQLDVEGYELKCTGHGIQVDVHDHLFLPNKKLHRFNKPIFFFNIVDGDCNFSNNNLTNWYFFPKIIKGNCYANLNNIKNFNGAPIVQGKMIATRQNKRTDYPLTQENYIKHRDNITENSVYAIPVQRMGEIYSICEDDNSCIIKFKDKTRQKFKLNEIEYLGNIENLLI